MEWFKGKFPGPPPKKTCMGKPVVSSRFSQQNQSTESEGRWLWSFRPLLWRRGHWRGWCRHIRRCRGRPFRWVRRNPPWSKNEWWPNLVGGLEHVHFRFPYIGHNHPKWHIFQRGGEKPPTRNWDYTWLNCLVLSFFRFSSIRMGWSQRAFHMVQMGISTTQNNDVTENFRWVHWTPTFQKHPMGICFSHSFQQSLLCQTGKVCWGLLGHREQARVDPCWSNNTSPKLDRRGSKNFPLASLYSSKIPLARVKESQRVETEWKKENKTATNINQSHVSSMFSVFLWCFVLSKDGCENTSIRPGLRAAAGLVNHGLKTACITKVWPEKSVVSMEVSGSIDQSWFMAGSIHGSTPKKLVWKGKSINGWWLGGTPPYTKMD